MLIAYVSVQFSSNKLPNMTNKKPNPLNMGHFLGDSLKSTF